MLADPVERGDRTGALTRTLERAWKRDQALRGWRSTPPAHARIPAVPVEEQDAAQLDVHKVLVESPSEVAERGA